MEILFSAFMAAMIVKFVDWLKFISQKNFNAVVTQAAVWIVGVVLVVVAANSNLFGAFAVNGVKLGVSNLADQVLVGLGLASFGAAFFDVKKSLDATDSANTGKLLQ